MSTSSFSFLSCSQVRLLNKTDLPTQTGLLLFLVLLFLLWFNCSGRTLLYKMNKTKANFNALLSKIPLHYLEHHRWLWVPDFIPLLFFLKKTLRCQWHAGFASRGGHLLVLLLFLVFLLLWIQKLATCQKVHHKNSTFHDSTTLSRMIHLMLYGTMKA